jgi:hypothetical protein
LLEQISWSCRSRKAMAITKELPAISNPVSHTDAFYLSFSKNPSPPPEPLTLRSWWSGSCLYLKFFSDSVLRKH